MGLCGSREEAEDLVQETFARVLRKPRILRSEDDVGYLLRVLRNTFFSQRRTAARRPQTTALPDDLDLVEDRSAIQPETQARIGRAVRARSRHCPTTSATRWSRSTSSGCPIARRRTRCRVREATITTRLHRARQRVARALTEQTKVALARVL